MDNALLSQIQKGRKLKKAVTNDRSAPSLAPAKPTGGGGGPVGGIARPPVPSMAQPPSMSQPPSIPHTSSAPAPLSTGPQLGGLFANGMPTLRKTRGAAVDTGRGFASPSQLNTPPPPPPPPSAPPSAPPSTPPSAPSVGKPLFHNQTLPRGFKMPPVPGRVLPTSPAPVIASGVPPKTQASLVPPVPGRSRSNSSPQRPIPPPPPPRMVPSPPASPNVPRTTLAVPPALPPGRPRASSASAPNTPPVQQPRGPRSPLPSAVHPIPLTEGGRYTFRPLSDLPKPRQFNKSMHVYPSGESRGNAYPLNYDKIY